MPAELKTFNDYQAAHASLHLGTYFSRDTRLSSGVHYLSSERITDSYWNYAYRLSDDPRQLGPQIADVREYAATINRPVSIAVDNARASILESVADGETSSEEVWMSLVQVPKPVSAPLPGYAERLVTTDEDMDLFLEIFEDAYGEGDPDSPGYSGLPAEYPDSLRYAQPGEGVSVAHLLGTVDGQPAAIASAYMKPPYAGLYNVGTRRRARRRGLGTRVSQAAMLEAAKAGAQEIFLQTEPDSEVEELYSKLGFERLFVGAVIELE